MRSLFLQHVRLRLSTGVMANGVGVRPREIKRVLCAGGGSHPAVEAAEYAVRGAVASRATELSSILQSGDAELPFKRVTLCNIGNPQSLQQAPLTHVRQTLAAVVCPSLLDSAPDAFPSDVVKRARGLLGEMHGVGAYSASQGVAGIRKRVAKAIEKRDGIPCNSDNIFLTNGASEGVKVMLSLLLREKSDGILIPLPQYPLYSASMTLFGGTQIGYYLDENQAWALGEEELSHRLEEARASGVEVRAIVVINPGNPTGQVLTRKNMEALVRFCERERLVLLADEVYQKNVYVESKPFVSFKKVVSELGSNVELVSFHSVSKGVIGECGLRGGYMELHNIGEHAHAMVLKMMSVSLCSNLPGQIAVDLMMAPPAEGDESFALYKKETQGIFESLKRRAARLAAALNSFEGVSCNDSEGAMYLFPQIRLPKGAYRQAEKRGLNSPDLLYCLELLEETGICVVPGSGFGQVPGTLHFRTTFLPPEDQVDEVAEKMHEFHKGFLQRYATE